MVSFLADVIVDVEIEVFHLVVGERDGNGRLVRAQSRKAFVSGRVDVGHDLQLDPLVVRGDERVGEREVVPAGIAT